MVKIERKFIDRSLVLLGVAPVQFNSLSPFSRKFCQLSFSIRYIYCANSARLSLTINETVIFLLQENDVIALRKLQLKLAAL
jgi:hypothetical protein